MRLSTQKLVGFTLTELLVSIVISVIILGGIFFFISGALLSLSGSSAQSDFLKSFYSFTTILDSGEFEILSTNGYDIGLLVSPGTGNGVLVGVIHADTNKLITPSDYGNYLPALVAYRQVTESDIASLRTDISGAYDLEFLRDTIFREFYVKDFSLTSYNGGSTTELLLDIFPLYQEGLKGLSWSTLPNDEVFRYSFVF